MFDFSNPVVFLSWLVFLPAVVALVIAVLPLRGETIKWISLVTTAIVFAMSLGMVFRWTQVDFQVAGASQANGGLPSPCTDHLGVAQPEVGLIVKFNNITQRWEDELGRNWNRAVRFRLPDTDVFAINANTDLSYFRHIVPCGISQHGVTSFEDLGHIVSMAEVDIVLKSMFERHFGPAGLVSQATPNQAGPQ